VVGTGAGPGWPLVFGNTDKRIKRERKRREALRERVEEAFSALAKTDAPVEELVAPYLLKEPAKDAQSIPVSYVDFDALVQNLTAVQALLNAYQQMLDDDDDEVMLYV